MDFKVKGSNWLWDKCDSLLHNQYVCFRQKINVQKKNARTKAYLYLSCDTTYELYINGKFVNFGQYLALPENKFFDKLDISEYVVDGENLIAIEVYYQGYASSCYATGTPGLIYFTEVDGRIFPNDSCNVAHDPGYTEGNLPLISNQLGPSFEFDGRKASDWYSVTYVENDSWKAPCKLNFDDILTSKIKPRPVEKLVFSQIAPFKLINKGHFTYTEKQTELPVAHRMRDALMCVETPLNTVQNQEVVVDEDNTTLIFDLGEETAGYFTLEFTADSELIFDVAYGEHLTDLRIRSAIGNRNFAFTYFGKVGLNRYSNFFRRLAGRYIQINIRGVKGKCVIHTATLIKGEYPVKEKAPMCIDDRLHRKIYETCIKTLKSCMHEHYEDCPWREQSLYAFDSRNQILAGYTVFENDRFVKSCLELMDSTLGEDGYQRICAPKSDDLKIPGFSLMWIIALCEYAMHKGKISGLEKMIGNARKMIEKYMCNVSDDGVVLLPDGKNYWFFYDWAEGLAGKIKMNSDQPIDEQKTDAVFNLEICYALKKLIDMLDHFGQNTIKLKQHYKMLKNGVNKVFYNKQRKLYNTFDSTRPQHYCQIVQALAILSGVAVNKKALRKALAFDKDLIQATLSTMILRYEALMEDENYLEIIMDEIAEIWGGMLYRGATTFYETALGEADFYNAGSLCHGWSAIPLVVYQNYYVDRWLVK